MTRAFKNINDFYDEVNYCNICKKYLKNIGTNTTNSKIIKALRYSFLDVNKIKLYDEPCFITSSYNNFSLHDDILNRSTDCENVGQVQFTKIHWCSDKYFISKLYEVHVNKNNIINRILKINSNISYNNIYVSTNYCYCNNNLLTAYLYSMSNVLITNNKCGHTYSIYLHKNYNVKIIKHKNNFNCVKDIDDAFDYMKEKQKIYEMLK